MAKKPECFEQDKNMDVLACEKGLNCREACALKVIRARGVGRNADRSIDPLARDDWDRCQRRGGR